MSLTIKNLGGGGSGIKPEDFGCTEMEVIKITPTSDTSSLQFTHSFDTIPEVLLMECGEIVHTAAGSQYYYKDLIARKLPNSPTFLCGGGSLRYLNSGSTNRILGAFIIFSTSGQLIAQTGTVKGVNENGGESTVSPRLKAGTEYTFYVMR